MSTRRPHPGVVLAGLLAIGAIFLGTLPTPAPSVAFSAAQPSYTFVSAPDLFNADLGDVSGRPGWDRGDGNSINADYRAAIRRVMGEVAAHDPDAVLVAGDLVEGHWGQDVDDTGIFGPVDTYAQRLAAVRAAGNTYYRAWKDFWIDAGVSPRRIYPAVGDHDIGDNPWRRGFKVRAIPTFKDVWADHFTTDFDRDVRFPERPTGTPFEETSYATWLAPELLLVTVDVFAAHEGDVRTTVTGAHLAWLRGVLATTEADDTVIVQGHTPALGPVRQSGSSGLMLEGGKRSEFWATLDRHEVDLFLTGEVHANTARQAGHTVQISHGGLLHMASPKYLVGNIYADGRVEIETHTFFGNHDWRGPELWASSNHRPPARMSLDGPSVVSGGLSLLNGTVTGDWGDLALNPELGQ